MSNPTRPNVVQSLVPERTGPRDGLYQLTESSTHPTRIIGRDRFGGPVEETVCINAPREFVTMSGCINSVPMRTNSSTWNTPEGEKYGDEQLQRLVGPAGWIPLDVCPFTMQFRHWTHTPALVELRPGDEDCGGDPNGGCVHLREVIEMRRERARLAYAEFERVNAMLSPGEAVAMVKRFSSAVDAVQEIADDEIESAQHTTAAKRKTPRIPPRPAEEG